MLGIITLIIYFIPTFISYNRKAINKWTVLLINFFFWWTIIGWIVALVMSNGWKTEIDLDREEENIKLMRELVKQKKRKNF